MQQFNLFTEKSDILNHLEALDEKIKLEEAYIKKTDNIPSYYCTKHKKRLAQHREEKERIMRLL